MAMRVPKYQRRVGIKTARTRAPRVPTPRMPQITMPKVVPGAFGANVARATQALGEVGTKIAGHLLEMAKDDQDREVLRRETEYRQDLQNRLINGEEETIQINGQDVTRPRGLLRRQLNQAKGSTQELDKVYQEEIRNQYLEGLSRYQLDKLEPAIDSHYLSVRNSVITHEANQLDEDFKNITESNLAQKTSDASIIRDSEQLTSAIDDAIKTAEPYYRKFDEATRKILYEKITSNIVEAATISTLQNTGSLVSSQILLDSAKDKIAESTYSGIKGKLAAGHKSMIAETERIRSINKVNSRFDYIAKIADGTLNWANSAEIIRQVALTDPKLADAMTKNIKKGGFGVEEKDEVFMELAQSIFTSADPETISDFIVAALSETKTISRDRLAVLVYAARKRAEELNKEPGKGFLGSIAEMIITPNPLNTGVLILINTLKRIQGENAEGKRALEIANEEMQKQNLKDNPMISTFSEKGQEGEDGDGNKAIVFPDGRVEEIK